MKSFKHLTGTVVIEPDTCDRRGMETEQVWLTNLRTPGKRETERLVVHVHDDCI